MNSDWGFSSSSESDDDERPISKLRNDTEFYRGYYQGDYGCDWPNELQPKRRENLANSSILYQNDVANSSFANTSIANTSFVNTSFANISRIAPDDTATRIVSPKSILNKTPDDIVLVDEGGGRYRPVRVISKNEILSTRKEENYHVSTDFFKFSFCANMFRMTLFVETKIVFFFGLQLNPYKNVFFKLIFR